MDKNERGFDALRNMEDLDVEQGILYCNGEEAYIEILRAYCEEWENTGELIKNLFEQKDWKNYTVAVHGLKSSLFSIGVTKISGMAKQLEYAGKENRIDYIEENHAGLMEAYEAFFSQLVKNEYMCFEKNEEVEPVGEIKELSPEHFDKIMSDMEVAAYSFDIDTLVKLTEELEQYRYKGNVMKKALVPFRRKLEMSDYIPAVEMLANQKRKMETE